MTAENQELARHKRLRRPEMIFIQSPIYFVTAAFGPANLCLGISA
jgi:hypothetical protein